MTFRISANTLSFEYLAAATTTSARGRTKRSNTVKSDRQACRRPRRTRTPCASRRPPGAWDAPAAATVTRPALRICYVSRCRASTSRSSWAMSRTRHHAARHHGARHRGHSASWCCRGHILEACSSLCFRAPTRRDRSGARHSLRRRQELAIRYWGAMRRQRWQRWRWVSHRARRHTLAARSTVTTPTGLALSGATPIGATERGSAGRALSHPGRGLGKTVTAFDARGRICGAARTSNCAWTRTSLASAPLMMTSRARRTPATRSRWWGLLLPLPLVSFTSCSPARLASSEAPGNAGWVSG